LNIEDITKVSDLISELNQDLKNESIPTHEELLSRINTIKEIAKNYNVPVILNQKDFEDIFFKRLDTTPNEFYEEYSEEVEYSED